VSNATFNNISVISWRSVLLVEETGVPREIYRPVASHWQTLSHIVVSSTPGHELVELFLSWICMKSLPLEIYQSIIYQYTCMSFPRIIWLNS